MMMENWEERRGGDGTDFFVACCVCLLVLAEAEGVPCCCCCSFGRIGDHLCEDEAKVTSTPSSTIVQNGMKMT